MQSTQFILGTVTDVFTTGHDMLEVLLADQDLAEPAAENTAEGTTDAAQVPTSLEEISAEIAHPSTRAKAVKKLKLQARRKQKKRKRPKPCSFPL